MSVAYQLLVALAFVCSVCSLAVRLYSACSQKRGETVYIYFDEPTRDVRPDLIVVCRTECEKDEVVQRICMQDDRKKYIERR